MRLRQSLKNSAKAARNSLILAGLFLFFGCSSSLKPTYTKENIANSLKDICKNEYKIDVVVRLVGNTLWIYLPLEADLVAKAEKPQKYTESFAIEDNKTDFQDGMFNLAYRIRTVPEKEHLQQYNYSKGNVEKINNTWKALRRILFSMKNLEKTGPKLFCIITADIKNGYETKELFYYLDIKKVSYEFISWTEYQHRSIEESNMGYEILGDKQGRHIEYRDIPMEEFLAKQIQHRIKLKFQRPEVTQDADIDKEILKIVVNTLQIYRFADYNYVELNNQLSRNRFILNRAAIQAKPME
jgi:hypothetical protein